MPTDLIELTAHLNSVAKKNVNQAASYADQILFGSSVTFFSRSCSFSTDKLRKTVVHYSEPKSQSLREVPSSKIRFSRGVVRVFDHGKKKYLKLSLVRN